MVALAKGLDWSIGAVGVGGVVALAGNKMGEGEGVFCTIDFGGGVLRGVLLALCMRLRLKRLRWRSLSRRICAERETLGDPGVVEVTVEEEEGLNTGEAAENRGEAVLVGVGVEGSIGGLVGVGVGRVGDAGSGGGLVEDGVVVDEAGVGSRGGRVIVVGGVVGVGSRGGLVDVGVNVGVSSSGGHGISSVMPQVKALVSAVPIDDDGRWGVDGVNGCADAERYREVGLQDGVSSGRLPCLAVVVVVLLVVVAGGMEVGAGAD